MSGPRLPLLRLYHRVLQTTREFFDHRHYTEVRTPCLVPGTVPEEHIDLFCTRCGRFLNASPEPQMKRLVAEGMERIYQIGPAFRVGERGTWHSPEFTILEWYRVGADYRDLMEETRELVTALCATVKRDVPAFTEICVDDAFEQAAGWRPSRDFDADRFDRDMVERVEPSLASRGGVFLCDYPAASASLSRLRADDPLVAERFEFYLDGIELANGFSELVDAHEQVKRFEETNARRREAGREPYPVDRRFIQALRQGMPPCAGIAVGMERLVAALARADGIDAVMGFPVEEL